MRATAGGTTQESGSGLRAATIVAALLAGAVAVAAVNEATGPARSSAAPTDHVAAADATDGTTLRDGADGAHDDADGSTGGSAGGSANSIAGSTAEAGTAGAGTGNETGAQALPPLEPTPGQWVNPASSGRPWSDLGAVEGLLGFRGNPTRSWYGRGPVPERAEVLWSQTIGCSISYVGSEAKEWCGSGWTGQPVVFRSPEVHGGDWWVAVGGYNRSVNFYDPVTGDEVFPPFPTDDIIKGTVTVDPDGYPLLYTGSRDNFFHVVALDRDQPEELWRLAAADDQPTLWNDDWDSSALVIDDYLFEGGENSRFYGVKLNRGYDADGQVTVDPEVVFSVAGWDDQLLADLGDHQVSIEGSVAISGNVVYFSNSGGLVQGWDITEPAEPERVFRYWTGDDTDASIVIDGDGMLYVVSEYERGNQRSQELGQVFKLDPSNPDDPLVWSREASSGLDTGVWATPALSGTLLVVATDDGRLLGLDTDTGDERWVIDHDGPLWSSPVIADNVLIQGDCDGNLTAWDLPPDGAGRTGGANGASADAGARPRLRWRVALGGCIESTPAVWDGLIHVGSRTGDFYTVGDPALVRARSRN